MRSIVLLVVLIACPTPPPPPHPVESELDACVRACGKPGMALYDRAKARCECQLIELE